MKAKKYQLENGLKVLLIESHKSPVVSVQAWVRNGSADESKGLEGLSHFIEHLVFKGTKSFGVGEIASEVEFSGGDINAYTSYDQTVYYVTLSKHYLDKGLQVISELVSSPRFDVNEVESEREVVIEEIKRGLDSPHRRAHELMFSTAFPKHPYGRPIIGFEKVIRKVPQKRIKAFFESRYAAQNVMLVVAGDFSAPQIMPSIEGLYGSIPKKKITVVKRAKDPARKGPKITLQKSSFKEHLFQLGWRIPSIQAEDLLPLEVVAFVLGQGDSSRLMQELRIKRPLTQYSVSHVFSSFDPGLFMVSVAMTDNRLSEVLPIVAEELRKIQQEPVALEELAKAVRNMESEELYSLETVEGLARKFGTYEFYFKDYNYNKKLLQKLNQIKAEDIMRVAKKYLTSKNLISSFLSPDADKKTQKELNDWLKGMTKQKSSAKKQVKKAVRKTKVGLKWTPVGMSSVEPEKVTFPNGATALLWPQKDSPVVHFRMASLAGMRKENDAQLGLTEMFSRVWSAETKSRTEEEIQRLVESEAASVQSYGGKNSVSLAATFLAPVSEKILDLFSDLLINPTFSDAIIDRERIFLNQSIKAREDHPAQVAILEFTKSIFKGHSYGRDPMGSEETLAKLNHQALSNYYNQFVGSKNANFVVVGDIDPAQWKSAIESLSKKMPSGTKPNLQESWTKPADDVRLFRESKKEQSHIVFGFPGLNINDPRRYALQVLQGILAGMGGRLFVELRDKASLAYTVSPIRMEGLGCGYFGAYIGCSPEKANKAIQMMKDEFQRLVDKKPDLAEVQRSQRYLIGSHDIDLQRTSALANLILFDDIYGIPVQEALSFADRIGQVTPEQIWSVAKELFVQPHVLSVVGQQCPW